MFTFARFWLLTLGLAAVVTNNTLAVLLVLGLNGLIWFLQV